MANERNIDDDIYNDSDSTKTVEALLAKLGSEAGKLRDPVVLASLLYVSKTERERSNKLFMTLVQKIDLLARKIESLEASITGSENAEKEPMLPDIDQRILAYVRQRGTLCAEEIQKRFNYRGTNAASARLNRLCKLGVLEKVQVGRKVYFKAT